MKFPEVVILSLEDVERFEAEPTDVCISIRSPEGGGRPDDHSRPAALSPNFRDVLRLAFDDLAKEQPPGSVEFTKADVEAVVDFAWRHRDAGRLVVHCQAGKSRSAAVGMALGLAFGLRWQFPAWYTEELRRSRRVVYGKLFDAVHIRARAAKARQAKEEEG